MTDPRLPDIPRPWAALEQQQRRRVGLVPSESREDGEGLRPSTPVCPRCAINLRGEKHATGIAWRCPACGGQSLNFSQFRRMIPGARVDDIWLTATAEPVISPHRGKCPECRRIMHAVLVPWQNREIELDLCRPCQRLWMDNAENPPPLPIGAKGSASRSSLSSAGSLRKPPVVRTGQSARSDKVSEEFYTKLLKVRSILEKRGEPRVTHRAAFALLLMVLGWILAKRLGFH